MDTPPQAAATAIASATASATEVDFGLQDMPGDSMHEVLADLRQRAPVVRVSFLGQPAWLITRHAALRDAFRDGERFPPAPIYRLAIGDVVGRTFQTMEGAEHRLYRRLATPAFRSRAVARLEEEGLATLAEELLEDVQEQGEVELTAAFTRRYPFLVICRMLGIPRDAEEKFHRWALAMLSAPLDREAGLRASAEFTRYLGPVVQERRREPREDVISELAQVEVEGHRLKDEEIFSQVRLLFAVGATSTHDAIGNMLFHLLVEPERWRRVVEEPEIREAAVEESLRYETPIANLPRLSASEAITFEGCEVPANSFLLFSMASANRDPAVFSRPDVFDLDRAARGDEFANLMTFGPGLRSCPGMHLARREMAAVLDVLAKRAPGLCLVGDPAQSAPTRAVIRGPHRLNVALH